jgi:hypothetical protein
MDTWSRFLSKVDDAVNSIAKKGYDVPYFRGHGDETWPLVPSLGRKPYPPYTESVLYYDFLIHAGALIPANSTPWDILFTMRHHAVPTRLLDWTETFSVALYFAVKNFSGRAAIWVLDASELNEESCYRDSILHPEIDLKHTYYDYFIAKSESFIGEVVAIRPTKTYLRVSAQKGVFTAHNNLTSGLGSLFPGSVSKIILPKSALAEAKKFLRLSGVNEYTLFPDLDGLSRWLGDVYEL